MKVRSLQCALSRSIVVVALILSLGGGSVAALCAFFSARELQDQVLESIAGLVRTDRVAPSVLSDDDDDHDHDEENIVVRHLTSQSDTRRPRFSREVPDGLQTVRSGGEFWKVWITDWDSSRRFISPQYPLPR